MPLHDHLAGCSRGEPAGFHQAIEEPPRALQGLTPGANDRARDHHRSAVVFAHLDGDLRVYDVLDPATPVLLRTIKAKTLGLNAITPHNPVVMGNYLYGQQTIRYVGSCHPNGREVPLIGRLAPNGQVLAMHFYNVAVDANCQDTGQVPVPETLWQRRPDR